MHIGKPRRGAALPSEPLDAACDHQQWPHLRHDVGLHISIVVLAGPDKAAAGLEALWWCHGLGRRRQQSAVWQHAMRQQYPRSHTMLGARQQLLSSRTGPTWATMSSTRQCRYQMPRLICAMALRQPQSPPHATAPTWATMSSMRRCSYQMPRFSNCCWYLVR